MQTIKVKRTMKSIKEQPEIEDVEKLVIKLTNNFTKILSVIEIKKYPKLYWVVMVLVIDGLKKSLIIVLSMLTNI